MPRPLVLVVLCLLLAACGSDTPGDGHGDVIVEGLRLVRETNGDQIVTGTLVNPGPGDVAGAQIEIDLFGPNDETLEALKTEVGAVAAGDSVAFRAVVDLSASVSGASVRRILVF